MLTSMLSTIGICEESAFHLTIGLVKTTLKPVPIDQLHLRKNKTGVRNKEIQSFTDPVVSDKFSYEGDFIRATGLFKKAKKLCFLQI